MQMNKFPALLRNISQKEVFLPAGSVVALGHTTEVATTVERMIQQKITFGSELV